VLRPLVALIGLAVVAGCGAAERAQKPRVEACPPGVAELRVEDILPEPPPGTEIIRSDPQGAAQFKKPMRQALGDRLRSINSRVVAKAGRLTGTGVFVLNLDQRVNPSQVILGAEATADELGAEPQEFTIAGEDAVLVPQGEGLVASGVVGECASVTLMAPNSNEAQLRAVAETIRRAE
jgi:hypothetical protein